MYRIFIIITVIVLVSINVFGQFQYDEYDDVISFSYIYPKIDSLKSNNEINTLNLPSFNNDSLYWTNNIERVNPKNRHLDRTSGGTCGFVRDTMINFFEVANRVKIKEGYIWLYKISSPTAFSLGVKLKNLELNPEDYICAHSNFHDSTSGPYMHREPEVITGDEIEERIKNRPQILMRGFYLGIVLGNEMYIEIFSPNKKIKKSGLVISNWSYYYPTNFRLSDAPEWVRKKYPDIDFDFYENK